MKALLVRVDRLALWVCLGQMVQQDHQALMEKTAHQVLAAHLVLVVLRALLVCPA